jgi:hypothetical protein
LHNDSSKPSDTPAEVAVVEVVEVEAVHQQQPLHPNNQSQ